MVTQGIERFRAVGDGLHHAHAGFFKQALEHQANRCAVVGHHGGMPPAGGFLAARVALAGLLPGVAHGAQFGEHLGLAEGFVQKTGRPGVGGALFERGLAAGRHEQHIDLGKSLVDLGEQG